MPKPKRPQFKQPPNTDRPHRGGKPDAATNKTKGRKQQLSNRRTLEEFAAAINAATEDEVKGIIRKGRLLQEAKDQLEHGDWGRLFEQKRVTISIRIAQMYMRIANNPVFSNAKNFSHLPPSYTTLNALLLDEDIDDQKLQKAIDDGKIHAGIEGGEVKELIEQMKEKEDDDDPFEDLRRCLHVAIFWTRQYPDADQVAAANTVEVDEELYDNEAEKVDLKYLPDLWRWVMRLHFATAYANGQQRLAAEEERATTQEEEETVP
jgi:hypothetical protein